MTRVRLPSGLPLSEGVYEDGDTRLAAGTWDELREAPGVEVECVRHPDRWWPTAGKDITLRDLRTWRCPNCVWSFRQGLAGKGGTPQF